VDFRERTVVITGGTGALGAAVADAFLTAGATCHIPYHFEEELRSFPHRDRAA
jgi:NAD(P)-dependent dehydrogenase (short-subunit alcohol dehydrogenase family)